MDVRLHPPPGQRLARCGRSVQTRQIVPNVRLGSFPDIRRNHRLRLHLAAKRTSALEMSAYCLKADALDHTAELRFLAISGHRATRVRSRESSEIGCTEIPLESVQISLGILRISGSPQKGTEKGSFPYIPVRALSWGPAPIGRRTQRVPEHCAFVGRVEVA